MATQNVCNWNKYGYCKHGDMCRKLHVKEICEDSSCNILCCLKRHPNQCKFYTKYKRCKFDPCAFLHIEEKNTFEILEKENEVILSKINDINKSIKDLEAKEVESENFIEKLVNIEKKLEIFTNIREEIYTKDEVIESLTKKVTEMEGNLKIKDDLINDLVLRIKNVEDKQKSVEAAAKPIKKFKCKNCDFETHSEIGLKQHNSKKHTKQEDQRKKIGCAKCTFKANSTETLDVHIGKIHADNFNCGLCEKTFETKENLETHLNTCEIYQCTKCKHKEATLPNIKDHVVNIHNSEKYLMIDNFKMSRDDSDEVTWKNFYFGFE